MKRALILAALVAALLANATTASAQCGTGVVLAETCGAIDWYGCCGGTMATWCDDVEAGGPLCGRDCAAQDEVCSWSESIGATCAYSVTLPEDGHELSCCDPQCEGKACGSPDACGGICKGPKAVCAGGDVCAPDGTCCDPQCDGKTCGDDGCGGTCGTCGCGEACLDGACVFLMCKQAECGANGCGGSCGECALSQVCTPWGQCCQPTCGDAVCGDDGCGGTCGTCGCGERCVEGACIFQACDGLQCGDDGCGGGCGHCDEGATCVDGTCQTGWVCDPDWQGGSDGCDCDCGAYDPDCDDPTASVYRCEDWQTCDATGHCVGECVPTCDGLQCGDDGCGGQCGTCAAGTSCSDDGQCVTGWSCDPYYKGDGYTCNCGCGEVDPDCADPEAYQAGCEFWQTCNEKGECVPEVCTPDCHGKVCGADGCGGTCGTCPLDATVCLAGACVVDPCLGVTYQGCCDGNVRRWCAYDYESEGYILQAEQCGDGETCGWDADAYSPAYACGVEPVADPSGELPLACPACHAACVGKPCGASDGCGGTCGCPDGLQCQEGQCLYCTPNCWGKVCGDDGCGAPCGTCDGGSVCWHDACCSPACDGKTCGDDGCGGTCGSCTWPATCQDGQCCTPTCDGVTCGNDDGCGGTCGCTSGSCVDGTCQDGCGGITYEGCCDGTTVKWCSSGSISTIECTEEGSGASCGWDDEGGYYWCGDTEAADPTGTFPRECAGACTPDCTGKSCDQDNGCGHPCGCAAGQTCEAGQCVACTPDCLGRSCGDDGCGGTCGECGEGLACHPNGVCVDPCQGIGYEGCCSADTLRYCDEGSLVEIACDAADGACGWNDSGWYDCGTDGAAEPTGAFAKDCPPPACVPACAGKACGDDGCGGLCGACGAGQECKDSACVPVDAPDCTGKECGPDGFGGSCGTCPDGETCSAAGQCEATVTPDVVDDTGTDTATPDTATPATATPDPATPDTVTTPDEGGGESGGGGGGCTVTATRPAFGALLLGLAALAMLVLRRRAA